MKNDPNFFLKMEDDLNFFENARWPYCHKLKMTSIFFFKRKTTSTYLRIEDDLKKTKTKKHSTYFQAT